MPSAKRPVQLTVLGFALGVTLLILVPNLVDDLFVRQTFGEFGSRGATVTFNLFLWGVTLLPAAAAFSLPVYAVRRILGRWPWPLSLGSGLLCGGLFGLAAGLGLLNELISTAAALGLPRGLGPHLAGAALAGLALALGLAAVAVVAATALGFARRLASSG